MVHHLAERFAVEADEGDHSKRTQTQLQIGFDS
ncbi:hypothetical protein WCLP8_1820006 [uncultured Gammaproteobacteria bacterium]